MERTTLKGWLKRMIRQNFVFLRNHSRKKKTQTISPRWRCLWMLPNDWTNKICFNCNWNMVTILFIWPPTVIKKNYKLLYSFYRNNINFRRTKMSLKLFLPKLLKAQTINCGYTNLTNLRNVSAISKNVRTCWLSLWRLYLLISSMIWERAIIWRIRLWILTLYIFYFLCIF